MASDGSTVQGGRNGRARPGDRDLETFTREVPKYAGSPAEFRRDHTQTFGHEENLRPDGSHRPRGKRFPLGSEREKRYNEYADSTNRRDEEREAYITAYDAAKAGFEAMARSEQKYYRAHTGGLRPDQHARLEPFARAYAAATYTNARGRERFLQLYPHGYHSLDDQNDHYRYAENACVECEHANRCQERHQKYRCDDGDSRRDKYGRPMSRAHS